MATIFDLPKKRAGVPVTIDGIDLLVYGVSFDGLIALGEAVPEIEALLRGQTKMTGLTIEGFVTRFPEAAAALIAAGLGDLGNKDVEARARTLYIGEQIAILEKMLERTFPQGLGPLVERARKFAGTLGFDVPGSLQPESLPTGSFSSLEQESPKAA